MTIERPSRDQLASTATELGLTLEGEDLDRSHALVCRGLAALEVIDEVPEEVLVERYPREPGYRPDPSEDVHHA